MARDASGAFLFSSQLRAAEEAVKQGKVVVIYDSEVLRDIDIRQRHASHMVESLVNVALGEAHEVTREGREGMACLIECQPFYAGRRPNGLRAYVKGSVKVERRALTHGEGEHPANAFVTLHKTAEAGMDPHLHVRRVLPAVARLGAVVGDDAAAKTSLNSAGTNRPRTMTSRLMRKSKQCESNCKNTTAT